MFETASIGLILAIVIITIVYYLTVYRFVKKEDELVQKNQHEQEDESVLDLYDLIKHILNKTDQLKVDSLMVLISIFREGTRITTNNRYYLYLENTTTLNQDDYKTLFTSKMKELLQMDRSNGEYEDPKSMLEHTMLVRYTISINGIDKEEYERYVYNPSTKTWSKDKEVGK